jgi:Mg2+-importing ATPase
VVRRRPFDLPPPGADASIILVIIFISGLLGFWQERSAADAPAKLLAIVKIRTSVLRGGTQKEVPVGKC